LKKAAFLSPVRFFRFCGPLFVLVLSVGGCERRAFESLPREELFTLSIGKMEDQIDLFQTSRASFDQKTTIFMRDGTFYIGNGASYKVMEFTSYGDLLSLYYNPDENPKPIILQSGSEGGKVSNRRAHPYAFRQVGEIAVSSRKVLYVEDHLPPERGIFDEKLNMSLNSIVLRFDGGEYKGYLGQEGVGGTPFPYVQGIKITNRDEVVVLCRTLTDWIVYWYSAQGELLSTVKVSLNKLPMPEGEKLLPHLETVLPDNEDRRIYLKLNYYKEGVDASTGTKYGIEGMTSRIFWMNVETSKFEGSVEVPQNTRKQRGSGFFETQDVEYLFEFIGVISGGRFFFLSREDNDAHQLLILNSDGKVLKRRMLSVEDSELVYSSFHVSQEGILSALLATESAVKIVWWRSDGLLSGR